MKKDRRHELQKNELADWVGHSVERVKPYGKIVGLTVTLALILGIGWWWWSSRSKKEEGERQIAVADLLDPLHQSQELFSRAISEIDNFEIARSEPMRLTEAERERVETEFEQLREEVELQRLEAIETQAKTGKPGSLARRTAALAAGDIYLTKGTELVYKKEREQAVEYLTDAIGYFEDVIDSSTGEENTMVRERATWSLAAAYQARGDEEDLDAARGLLNELAEGTFYRDAAKNVLELMDKNPEFFAMFEQLTEPSTASDTGDDDEDSPFRDNSGNLLGPGGGSGGGAEKAGGSAAGNFGAGVLDDDKNK